jgi:hypothetical protein
MTFVDYTQKSVSTPKILIEIDVSSLQLQWINIGSGIWKVNFNNSYPEVDTTLLDYFTKQIFDNIGSVRCDNTPLTEVNSLLQMTTTYQSFLYTNKTLYISIENYDPPFLHIINIGIIHGFSKEEFTPKGTNLLYEGRLSKVPSLGYSRDPLYFGKIAYPNATLDIINADGKFDNFADAYDVYGNAIRILFGYKNLDYSEYQLIYSGYMETIKISEDYMSVTAADSRKKLTTKVHYTCINKNALDAIYDLLNLNFPIDYSDIYFNTSQWDVAKLFVPNVTISMDSDTATDEILKFIEGICTSCFGLFIIQPDGKYTFKLIDSSQYSYTTIPKYDILTSPISITYDPSQVLSSVKVSYDKVNNANLNGYKTTLTDTTWEDDVYKKYKVKIENEFDTYLVDHASAQLFVNKIMDYTKDVHGELSIDVPMKYYSLVFGGVIDIEINRENSTMLGLKKCEILGKTYNLEEENINLDLRIISNSILSNYVNRVTTLGDDRSLTDMSIRVVRE